MKVKVLPTLDALARAAAENFVAHAREAIAARGKFTVALTGGTTPKDTYEMLGTEEYASQVDWPRVQIFWGDERAVPPDHKDSNYRMVREALLDHITIPEDSVHRMHGEAEPVASAAAYEQRIADIVGDRFDLVHLGMGGDTHIMSLFPGSSALAEKTKRVVGHYAESVGMWRITMTAPVVNAARHITFIVAGADKADAVARVLEGPRDPDTIPAQIVEPTNGEVLWLIDIPASTNLTKAL